MLHIPQEKILAIAQAIYSGENNSELRQRFNAAERTVKNWRNHPQIKQAVEDLKNSKVEATKQAIAKSTEEEVQVYLDQLKDFKDRRRKTAIALQVLASKAIKPIGEALDGLEGRKLKPSEIAQLSKAAAELIREGSAAEADALGIDEVIQRLKEQMEGRSTQG